jgi:hypothetical protein
MDAFTEFEHEGWERVAGKYDSVWSSSTRWQVPTARFVFDAERNAGVRTAGLLARQTPEALNAIQAAIERGMRLYVRGDGFAIPKAAYVVAVRKG